MSFGTKMFCLVVAAILCVTLAGSTGYWAVSNIASKLESISVHDSPLRYHLETGMMHDAIRADVLAAIIATNEEEEAEAHSNLSQHVQHIRSMMRQALAVQLPPHVRQALSGTTGTLEEYVLQAERIAALSLTDRFAAYAEMRAFSRRYSDLEGKLSQISDMIESGVKASEGEVRSTVAFTKHASVIIFLVSAFSSVCLSVLVIRGLRLSGQKIVSMVASSSSHLAFSSEKLSLNSETLSSELSQNVLSLEEITESVRALNLMVQQNAERAALASTLIQQASWNAETSEIEMQKLFAVINASLQSHNRIEEFFGRIDHLLSQAGLVAQSLSDEAAKAGDSGQNFRAIADKVQSLSEATASSARGALAMTRANLEAFRTCLKGAVENGVVLGDVFVKSRQISDLIAQITSASYLQAESVSHISNSINQLEMVNQTSALNAEDTAAVSRELASQATNLYGVMLDLIKVIEGSGNTVVQPLRYGLARARSAFGHNA